MVCFANININDMEDVTVFYYKCVIIFQLGEFEKNEITCCSLIFFIKLCFFERRPFV